MLKVWWLKVTFNKKITIQKKTTVKNADGYPTTGWVDFYTVWAYVNGVSDKEFLASMAEQHESVVNFTVRYFKALDEVTTTDYRIVFQGKNYDINGIDNFEFANKTLKFRATEGLNNG